MFTKRKLKSFGNDSGKQDRKSALPPGRQKGALNILFYSAGTKSMLVRKSIASCICSSVTGT